MFTIGSIQPLGLNPSLMRRGTTGIGNVWVIPGHGWLCLAQAMSAAVTTTAVSGLACNRDTVAAAGRLVTWTEESGGHDVVVGLAPNGVRTVTIVATNGSATSVDVRDNVYGVTLAGRLGTVRFGGRWGQVVVSVPHDLF